MTTTAAAAATDRETWPALLLRHFGEFAAMRRQGYWVQAARRYPEGYAIAIRIGDSRIRNETDEVRDQLEAFLLASSESGAAGETGYAVATGIAGSDHILGPLLGTVVGGMGGIYLTSVFDASVSYASIFIAIGCALAGAGAVLARDLLLVRRDRRRALTAAGELIRTFDAAVAPPDESSVYTVDYGMMSAVYFHRYDDDGIGG